jgi:hypothetical protein
MRGFNFKLILLLNVICLSFCNIADGITYYNLDRNHPLGLGDKDIKITANFGQFRNSTGSYKVHDGIDYRASIGTKVYSLHGGTVTIGEDDGWGRYVIVTNSSGAFATRYAHLSKIFVKNSDSIGANTLIGLSGNTGKSTGPHLHFGLGPSVFNDGEVNPIVAGLRQGSYGNPEILSISHKHTSVSKTNEYIIYYDENTSKKVDISTTFRPLQIIAEAYQSAKYPTNPYKVEFIITKIGDTTYKSQKTIEFDGLNFEVSDYYRTVPPYKTYFTGEDYKNFFYMDWTPEVSGTYEVEVKVYVANWENNMLVYPAVSMKRQIFIADSLYDAIDPQGMYAWQPIDGEISAAGVIRAAGVEWPKPRCVTDLSNTIFTTNITDVSPDFQKYTEFTVAADRATDWTIRIKDMSGNERHSIEKKNVAEAIIKWDGAGVSDGKYSYEIEAKDPLTAIKSIKQGISDIMVDNTKPELLANLTSGFPTKTSIISSLDSTSIAFQPKEDLYSVGVNIVDALNCNNKILTGLGWSPNLKQGETFTVNWDGVGCYPDGSYRFEIVMTDLAGNISKVYSGPVVVNVSGSYVVPIDILREIPVPYFEYRSLAVDGKGNYYYVPSQNNAEILECNAAGQVVRRFNNFTDDTDVSYSIKGIQGMALDEKRGRLYVVAAEPPGLITIKLSNGKIENSMIINNVNVFDGIYSFWERYDTLWSVVSFGLISKGRNYVEAHYKDWADVFYHKYLPGTFSISPGWKSLQDEYQQEGFGQPKDITIDNDGNIYVIDSGKHRVLKYDSSGKGLMFEALKRDCGSTPEREERKMVSNAINVNYFVKDDLDPKGWRSHASIPGNAAGQYYIPVSIAVDKGNCLYIADTGNHRIQKFAPDGAFVSKFAEGRLNSPKGITVDGLGNIWVADTGNHRIVQFNPAGDFVKEYKSDEYEINPQKILIRGGKLYIADANHDKPLIWNVAGRIADVKIREQCFSPNNDGVKDTNRISYALSQPAKITIQAINVAGEVVGTVISESTRNIGMNEEVWNGSIDTASGKTIIPGGSYTLKIVAYFGDYIKSASVPVVVDTVPPQILFSSSEKAISPNGDSILDSTIFSYNITDDYSATIEAELRLKKNNSYVYTVWDIFAWQKWGILGTELTTNWDGKINGWIAQGKYVCELKATDMAGNTGYATCEVIVDTMPPLIENATADNPYFSPNNDTRKDQCTLGFVLSDNIDDNMRLTLKLKDNSGREISVLVNDRVYEKGDRTFIWDGRSPPEATLLPDGEYSLEIAAKDTAGNVGKADPVKVSIDTLPPGILILSASPNPFTPNDDGIKDTTAFNYSLSEPSFADLRVNRDDGKLFISNALYNTEGNTWTWDGKGARGELLGGDYSYYLYAEDRAANIATSETGAIVVDREPSLIPYCYAEPDPFSPVSASNNYTDIYYYVSRNNVQVQVAVLGREGLPLKNLVFGETKNKGEYTVRWHGDFMPGYPGPRADRDPSKVADGTYQFKIWAYDSYNDARGENANTLMVDNIPPYIAIYPVAVDQVKRTATLRYYLPEKATVEVAAYDETGIKVEDVMPKKSQEPGEYFLPWGLGSRSVGKTYFYVAAEDSAKNRDEKTTEIFSIDPEKDLTLANVSAMPDPFTPNGDLLKEQVKISYYVSSGVPEYSTSIDIMNAAGATVKRLVQNEPQNQGTYNYYWDGRIDTADPSVVSYAVDGIYYYKVTIMDRLGAKVESNGSVTLVSTKPTVNLALSPDKISPNGDGVADTTALNYGINYAVAWITSPAQIRLDILNSNSETVFTKTFAQTPGSYAYEWNVRDGGDLGTRISNLPAGRYYVYANATDALGTSAVPKSAILDIDYTVPEPSNFSITPQYAKLGTDLNIALSFDEALVGDPSVTLIFPNAATKTAVLNSHSGNEYNYNYTILSTDAQGEVKVRIEAQDLSLNPIVREKTFINDQINPAINSVQATPNPAKEGDAFIAFNVNEYLSGLAVKVTQQGASPIFAAISNLGGGNYRAKYSVFPNYDGPAQISIEAIDLAGNASSYASQSQMMVDTIQPTFSSISCEVENPDFKDYASEGSKVNINFKSSEVLKFDPEVKVNGNYAVYSSKQAIGQGVEYEYYYIVQGTDINGKAITDISGYDLANNLRESQFTDQFTIDLINPTVSIAEPGSSDIIASPSPFFTNADPEDAADRPNYTTLRYGISEYGYVTLKVYKVSNDRETYTRNDFTDSKLVSTLISGQWMLAGVHNTEWKGKADIAFYDSNSDTYADPGKYAFIVEVRDKAGNLTERKWGGTVWIQNNVLHLKQPETIGLNPDPLIFSPNILTSNSPNTTTKLWFKVLMSVTPESWSNPERIEVMGLPETKKVGTYTIKVFDSGNNWIRTIAKDGPLFSATDTFEVWDGRIGTGPDKLTPDTFVADGDYRLVVDVRDFAGNQAIDNLMGKWVTADSTRPGITNNQSGDNIWRKDSGTLYNVDFSDAGSKIKEVQYKIGRPGGSETEWLFLAASSGSSSFADNWAVDWSRCNEGENDISVRVEDIAGNETTLDNAFYVRKDISGPTNPSISINSGAVYCTARSVSLSNSASDSFSGVAETWVRNDNGSYVQYTEGAWDLYDSDGQRYVYAKFKDTAGNWSSETSCGIILDRVDPSIGLSTPIDGSFNPYLGTYSKNINVTDTTSGIQSITANIEKTDGTPITSVSVQSGDPGYTHKISWNGQNSSFHYVNEGTYRLRISASDNAGNPSSNSECNITLQDDQRISDSSADSTSPYLIREGNYLNLKWIEGTVYNPLSVTSKCYGDTGGYGDTYEPLSIDHSQTVTISTAADDGVSSYHALRNSAGVVLWECNSRGVTVNWDLTAGSYKIQAGRAGGSAGTAYTTVSYTDQKYNQYIKTSQDLGKHWQNSGSWPDIVDSYSTGPKYIFEPEPVLALEGSPIAFPYFIYSAGTKVFDIYGSGNNLYYRKGTIIAEHKVKLFPVPPSSIPAEKISWSSSAQITHTGTAIGYTVSMVKDVSENIYVAWEDRRSGYGNIYFQKVPYNFAPISGGVTNLMVRIQPTREAIAIQVATPEAPTLLEPGDIGGKEINTSRPTFKWKAPKDLYTEYRIQWSQVANAEGDGKSTKMNTSGSEKPNEAGTLYFAHQLDSVFDPALERNKTYYWKVVGKKADGTEIQSNDIFSFTCNPPFEISGITNYPNPFDPNKDLKTTIRYKLSKDADEVRIRIYDITGALVTELDGTTNGEGQDRWVNKYNDIKWDGRNGRGDLVLNGIYPFEVMARSGGTSVSGRGKIAVLK